MIDNKINKMKEIQIEENKYHGKEEALIISTKDSPMIGHTKKIDILLNHKISRAHIEKFMTPQRITNLSINIMRNLFMQ